MNCPKCGLINTGNLAVGLAMPQCMCQWQNTQEKCRIETVPAQGTLLPQRTWIGLTDDEAKKAFAEHNCEISKDLAGILARAIEAKLKEKNSG
jgi:hypothetical protein